MNNKISCEQQLINRRDLDHTVMCVCVCTCTQVCKHVYVQVYIYCLDPAPVTVLYEYKIGNFYLCSEEGLKEDQQGGLGDPFSHSLHTAFAEPSPLSAMHLGSRKRFSHGERFLTPPKLKGNINRKPKSLLMCGFL